jgi:hypothetical protein
LLICTCLTFAFANIQYFCIGSWVYTTWSDILFIKLVVLKFLSCTNFFFFFSVLGIGLRACQATILSLEIRWVTVAELLIFWEVLYLFESE